MSNKSDKPKVTRDMFSKLAWGSVVALLIAVVVLAFMNAGTSLHVRRVEISGSGSAAELVNQKLVVHFNRPLQKEVMAKQVAMDPANYFNISWQGNDMVINFTENLQADTDYRMIIGRNAEDVYHNKLGKDFTYTFHTKPLRLFYLDNAPAGQDSRIISVKPDFTEPQEIFKAANISKYAVSRQYLAVVVAIPGQPENKLVLKDLKQGTEREINFENLRVNKVIFSPTKNEMALVVQTLIKVKDTLIPDAGSVIRVYDLKTLIYRQVNPQDVANEVIDIIYAPDGRSILFKANDSNYYIAGLENKDDLVILGKHLTASTFNRQADKLLFLDFDPLQAFSSYPYFALMDSDKNLTRVSNNTDSIVDPQFFNNMDRILYAAKYKELEGTKGIFQLMIGNFDGKTLRLYTDKLERSLELPKISADDHYIVAERYEQKDMVEYTNQRDFQFQTKPGNAQLVVLDMITGEVTDKGIHGIDAVWQP